MASGNSAVNSERWLPTRPASPLQRQQQGTELKTLHC